MWERYNLVTVTGVFHFLWWKKILQFYYHSAKGEPCKPLPTNQRHLHFFELDVDLVPTLDKKTIYRNK